LNRLEENAVKLRAMFDRASRDVDLRGILGITSFKEVYYSLLPVQRKRMNEVVGSRLDCFLEVGNVISFAYVYPDGVIDNIGVIREGAFDRGAWNIYAKWYRYLNKSLDESSHMIAQEFNGVALTATSTGLSSRFTHVSQFFPTVISHRVHAEKAGIGWRGKNSLIVNPRYSCMIRLSGVITEESLINTSSLNEDCGECSRCEDVCTFLKNREKLEDYREQCRIYLDELELEDEVCGKCIKACVHSPRLNTSIEIPVEQPLNQVYYTSS
jgi:epoxyqueuosine reductase QueG